MKNLSFDVLFGIPTDNKERKIIIHYSDPKTNFALCWKCSNIEDGVHSITSIKSDVNCVRCLKIMLEWI